MEVNDEGGASLPYTHLDINHLEVDVDGLTDFGKLIGHELEANLRPAVTGIQADHLLGVGFGRANPSTPMRTAQEKYRQVLQDSVESLATYVAVSEKLIEAITRIAARYRDSDLTSATMANALRLELNAVAAEAQTAFQDKLGREQAQETQRELNRLRIGQA